MSDFHHGHEPRAEEIALHQKYLTLEEMIDAARLEGDEREVRRLTPLIKQSQGTLDYGEPKSYARNVEPGSLAPLLEVVIAPASEAPKARWPVTRERSSTCRALRQPRGALPPILDGGSP